MSERLMVERLRAERLLEDRVMATGTVKRLRPDEGYGLISPDEGDDDLLALSTSCEGRSFETLTEGARVTFEVHEGRRGLEAFGVVAINRSAG